MRTLLLVWLLAVVGRSSARSTLSQQPQADQECPRCDMIFSQIETTSSGERVQSLEMQQRGEPKSGTTFMYVWAHGALQHTCNFLNEWFGSHSCKIDQGRATRPGFPEKAIQLVFDPSRGGDNARCPCPDVNRVEIMISHKDKHSLPVDTRCRFHHGNSIAREEEGCLSVDGRPVANSDDVGLCVEEANCTITDDRLQFVIMRDPRAQAISTFYHEIIYDNKRESHAIGAGLGTVDEFVLATLPSLCRWMTIRYILFAGTMAEQSTFFWYADAQADASRWHHDWLASVGVHLPKPSVEQMVTAALNEQFDFKSPGRNPHPGEEVEVEKGGEEEVTSTWKNKISAELMEKIDDIMRQWLPPTVRARIAALP